MQKSLRALANRLDSERIGGTVDLSDGWYLSSGPIITANWEADSNNIWTVPVGGGFGKIFQIGKQPMNASVQAFYNVKKPDNGPDWTLRLQLQFLFPKKR